MVNGERNRINLLIENHSGQNVTLMTAGGAFHDPESGNLIKNVSRTLYRECTYNLRRITYTDILTVVWDLLDGRDTDADSLHIPQRVRLFICTLKSVLTWIFRYKVIPQSSDLTLLRERVIQELSCKLCQQKLGVLCPLDNG